MNLIGLKINFKQSRKEKISSIIFGFDTSNPILLSANYLGKF